MASTHHPFSLIGLLLLGWLGLAATLQGQTDVFRQFYVGRYADVARQVEAQPAMVNWREPGDGRTLLLVAADCGVKQMVEFLVSKGSDLNATDDNGNSAVTLAALKSYIPILEFLEKKGAKLDVYGAVALNRTNELERLLQRRYPWGQPPPPKDKPAPIMLASRYSNVEAMRVLLDNGANPFERDKAGRLIIHEAAARGQLDQITLLLKHGVSVNERTVGKETPLHMAAIEGDVDTVRFLLTKGADVKLVDFHERTAVHFAALGNKLDNLQLLLEKGGDPSAPSVDGPPLHIVIWKHGNLEMAKLLIDHGADLTQKDGNGKTPLELAVRYKRDDIVELLGQRGAK